MISSGTVHKITKDLKDSLLSSPKALLTWEDITPLARNEWICFVTGAKKKETNISRIKRVISDLSKDKRRPCCWTGCPHRNE